MTFVPSLKMADCHKGEPKTDTRVWLWGRRFPSLALPLPRAVDAHEQSERGSLVL